VIAAASFGNGLEMFDFTIFSFFATTIGTLFFPSTTSYGSLLMAVAVFGLGFVMRPLGGVVIGSYADRAGRKAAMTLTITLMSIGTALIAFAPTHATIGPLAPLLIIAGRLLQGFSAGGEVGAATSLLMESGSANTRGFRVSWQLSSQGGAALLGALFGYAVSHHLSPDALNSWGWRVPFVFGLLILPVGFYIRRTTHETFSDETREVGALREVFVSHRRMLVLGVLMTVGSTAGMYITVFYMPTYMIRVLGMPSSSAFVSSCLAGLILLLVAPLGGLLADRIVRRKPIVFCTKIVSALLILPAFFALNHSPSIGTSVIVTSLLMLCMAVGGPAGTLLLLEAFPPSVRATGLSIVYSVGVTVFGGFAQLAVTWLLSATGNPMSPAWYMIGCSAISFAALIAMREVPRETTR
jgi:MHS family proline/betaine transporter-like MFS transporter